MTTLEYEVTTTIAYRKIETLRERFHNTPQAEVYNQVLDTYEGKLVDDWDFEQKRRLWGPANETRDLTHIKEIISELDILDDLTA